MAKINPIQLQKYLKGMTYPASKAQIVEHARGHQADEQIQSVLDRIPDKQYDNPAAVSSAVSAAQK